ncbi:MAG: VTT domain-containing protein [Fibromonadaceae bacterium]|jgi:membrane-associated protein|nr:VTT domain-containing protein [Fibromonadaceae bacterium]
MEYLALLLDFIRNIDVYLGQVVDQYGIWVYALITLIIFCEVGLVVTPFLPGDSMLFAIGAMCAAGAMDISIVLTVFPVAAVLGDNFNRFLGAKIGHKAFAKGTGKIFNTNNYNKANRFFEKFGPKAVTICRFMPFFRTYVPFIAGMSGMTFKTFLPWSILGGLCWVYICSLAGYFFGNIPIVKAHFEFVILGIICVSALPVVFEWFKHRRSKERA